MMTNRIHTGDGRCWKRVGGAGMCALLALPMTASAQSGPYNLTMKFKPGEVSKYLTTMQMTITIPMPGQPNPFAQRSDVSLLQQVKVSKKLPNGGGETETVVLKTQGTRDGQPFNPPANAAPIVTVYDARGNVVATRGLPKSAPGMPSLDTLLGPGGLKTAGAYLPPRPVRPGDTWTQKVAIGTLGASGIAKSSFVRLENIGAFKTARIHTVVALPIRIMMDAAQQPTQKANLAAMTVSGTVKITTDSNFAISEGKTVRSASAGGATMIITPRKGTPMPAGPNGAPQTMTMAIKMAVGNNLQP